MAMTIPVVDFSECNKLREELAAHPLYQRRLDIEQAFRDELTALTRKYGLAIKADTRTEYGETYPDCTLEVPYVGTEGRYIVSDYCGLAFESVQGADILPCSPEERDAFKSAKADRNKEDEAIRVLSRKISDAHYSAMEQGFAAHARETMKEYAKEKPKPACACGQVFKTDKALAKHKTETGHGI